MNLALAFSLTLPALHHSKATLTLTHRLPFPFNSFLPPHAAPSFSLDSHPHLCPPSSLFVLCLHTSPLCLPPPQQRHLATQPAPSFKLDDVPPHPHPMLPLTSTMSLYSSSSFSSSGVTASCAWGGQLHMGTSDNMHGSSGRCKVLWRRWLGIGVQRIGRSI